MRRLKNVARQHAGVIEGPTRLLIAEDTDSVRDILRRQLEVLGMEADFAVDGKEALAALEDREIRNIIHRFAYAGN